MRFVAMMNFRLQRVLMFVSGSQPRGSGADPSLARSLILGNSLGWRRKRSVQWVKFRRRAAPESDSGPALALVF